MTLVVDTNVPLTANRWPLERQGCPAKCIRALRPIFEGERFAIDDGFLIIKEYQKKLRQDQPGVGNEFLKWVLTNYANPARCDRIPIRPRVTDEPNPPEDYEQFPSAEDLRYFDPPDRKFVAVAATHSERPPILQAMDSKWLGWYQALRAAGVRVRFVCYADVVPLFLDKIGGALPDVHESDRA